MSRIATHNGNIESKKRLFWRIKNLIVLSLFVIIFNFYDKTILKYKITIVKYNLF